MFWKKNIFFINFLWAASELSAPTVEVKKVNEQATHLIRYDGFLYDGLSSCLSPQWSGLSRVQSTFNIPEDLSPPPRTDCGVSRPLVSQRRLMACIMVQLQCNTDACSGHVMVMLLLLHGIEGLHPKTFEAAHYHPWFWNETLNIHIWLSTYIQSCAVHTGKCI